MKAIALALVLLAGCTNSSSLDDVIEKTREQMNHIAAQLETNRSVPDGSTFVSKALGISLQEVAKLTPKDYFAAVSKLESRGKSGNQQLLKFESSGEHATAYWIDGEKKSKSDFVKIDGRWYLGNPPEK